MLESSLCDYSGDYTLVKGTITITREADATQNKHRKEKTSDF